MIENKEHSGVEIGSERSFAVVFAVVFAVIGLYPWWFGGGLRAWALVVAAGLIAVSIVRPQMLAPLNRLWFKFGLLLAKIVNPIVMFLIYVITVLPIGLILRAFGKDLLRLRMEPNSESYWLDRAPPGPDPESMKEQF